MSNSIYQVINKKVFDYTLATVNFPEA